MVDKPVAPTAAGVRHLVELAHTTGRTWFLSRTGGGTAIFGQSVPFWRPRCWEPCTDLSLATNGGSRRLPRGRNLRGNANLYVATQPGSLRPGESSDRSGGGALRSPRGGVRRGGPTSGSGRSRRRRFRRLGVSAWAADPPLGQLVGGGSGSTFPAAGPRGAYIKQGMDVQEAALIAGRRPTEPGWGGIARRVGDHHHRSRVPAPADSSGGLQALLRRAGGLLARRRPSAGRAGGRRSHRRDP